MRMASVSGDSSSDRSTPIEIVSSINTQGSQISLSQEPKLKFKPVRKDTIYSFLFSSPDIIDGFVETLTKRIQISKEFYEQVLNAVIQFFVDLCGYQNFAVKDQNLDEIIIMLQNEQFNPDMKEVKNYILEFVSNDSIYYEIQQSIFKFISSLIKNLYDLECYDFLNDIQRFICKMAKAGFYEIVHTGVVISMKMITAMTQIIYKLEEEMQTADSSRKKSLECKLNICLKNMTNMYLKSFSKTCHLDDEKNRFVEMRLQCIEAICVWLKVLPVTFTTNHIKADQKLREYLANDSSKKVVMAAVDACWQLFNTNDFKCNVNKLVIEKLIQSLHPFCNHIIEKVAIAAIHILTVAVTENLSDIPMKYRYTEFNCTNAFSRNVANAWGKLIVAQFRKEMKQFNEVLFIKIYVENVPQFKNYHKMQCMVRATYEEVNELKNWPVTFRLLLRRKEENLFAEENYETLCFVVYELAKLIVDHRRSENSEYFSSQLLDTDFDNFNRCLIEFLPDLIVSYKEETTKLKAFLKMLLFIDVQYLKENVAVEVLEKLTNDLFQLFAVSKEIKTCKLIIEAMDHLGQGNDCISSASEAHVYSFIINNIIVKMCRDDHSSDSTAVYIIDDEYFLVPLVAVYESVNLNHKIRWEEIFFDWRRPDLQNYSPAIIGHYLDLCSHWIIWETNCFEPTDGFESFAHELLALMEKMKNYIFFCIEVIQQWNEALCVFNAFEGICRVCCAYQKFETLLKSPSDSVDNLNRPIENISGELVVFLKRVAFENFDKFPYCLRCKVLFGFQDLIEAECLPVSYYKYIFQYSYSHRNVYSDIYETLFKGIISVQEAAMPCIIISTFIDLLSDMPLPPAETDLIDTSLLMKHFALKISHSQDALKQVLKYGWDIILHTDERVSRFFQYFSIGLTTANKREMLCYFQDKICETDEANILRLSWDKSSIKTFIVQLFN